MKSFLNNFYLIVTLLHDLSLTLLSSLLILKTLFCLSKVRSKFLKVFIFFPGHLLEGAARFFLFFQTFPHVKQVIHELFNTLIYQSTFWLLLLCAWISSYGAIL